MSAHKDWCSCEDCVRDTPDDRHLACRAENKALEERATLAEARVESAWRKVAQLNERHDDELRRLSAARDAALSAQQEAAQKAERLLDCHAGPGTTEPACDACTACLTRELEALRAALEGARCGDCSGRGCEPGRVGGAGQADCATCGGGGYVTFNQLASARGRLRQLRDMVRGSHDAYYAGRADSYDAALRLLGEPE